MNMNEVRYVKCYDSYKVNSVTRDLRNALKFLQELGACGELKPLKRSKERYSHWSKEVRKISKHLGIKPEGYFLIAVDDSLAISQALRCLYHAYNEIKKLQDEAKGQEGKWE